nr:CRE-RBC-1 protein [Haemonchus contortus]
MVCADDFGALTSPRLWPGVKNLIDFTKEGGDVKAPQLRKLLAESFVAVFMSLFCFALAIYDTRWLFRLAAHQMDSLEFALTFGGGKEKRNRAAVRQLRLVIVFTLLYLSFESSMVFRISSQRSQNETPTLRYGFAPSASGVIKPRGSNIGHRHLHLSPTSVRRTSVLLTCSACQVKDVG